MVQQPTSSAEVRDEDAEARSTAAQRAARLLLADGDAMLEAFRTVHLRSAPHRTLDELRRLRSTLDAVVRLLTTDDPVAWARLERAARALGVAPASAQWDEDTVDEMPAPPPASRSSSPPSSGTFAQSLCREHVQPAHAAQQKTVPISVELLERARVVDRVLAWSVEDWACLWVDLEANPQGAESVWARYGVTGGAPVHDSVRTTWERRLFDPALRRRFDACVAYRRANHAPLGPRRSA